MNKIKKKKKLSPELFSFVFRAIRTKTTLLFRYYAPFDKHFNVHRFPARNQKQTLLTTVPVQEFSFQAPPFWVWCLFISFEFVFLYIYSIFMHFLTSE